MGIWDIYELMVSLSHDLKGEHHQFWMVETCWNPTNHGINLPSIWVIHHYLIPIPSHPSWHPAQRWAAAPKTTDPAAPRLWSQRRRRRRRPEKSHGLINEISWTYCGYIMEISWTYCGNMMDILWLNETRRLSLLEQLFTTGFKSHDPHAHFSQIGLAATWPKEAQSGAISADIGWLSSWPV